MYVDAAHLGNKVFISERDSDGVRHIKETKPSYVFYYTSPEGMYKSIYGDKLKRERCSDLRSFRAKLQSKIDSGKSVFESDVDPVFRMLEEKYPTDDAPDLHVSFIDIEADKDPDRSFSRTNDPYSIINAVTIHNRWEALSYTLVVPPPGMSMETCRDLLDGKAYQDEEGNVIYGDPEDDFGSMPEDELYFICEDEAELLITMLDILEDSDVITGWNSEWYDLPYIIQRIRITLGGEPIEQLIREDGTEQNPYTPSQQSIGWLKKLCLFPTIPLLKHLNHYGSVEKVYKLFGRVHLDYLDLYQKFTFEELHSYTLDFVLKREVNQTKIPYEGSLDQLYRNDVRRFTAYNRQDTDGLVALDKKMKMVDLANTMAHMAGVTLDKVLGSVVIIEQAILKRLHKMGYVAFDKSGNKKELPVPGAFVVDPDKGRYEWVCSFDYNSLYPTVIRLVNISPECIVGQFDLTRTKEKWWRHFLDFSGEAVPDEDMNQQMVRALIEDEKFREEYLTEDRYRTAGSAAWKEFTATLEYHSLIDGTDEPLTFIVEGTGEEITMTAQEWKETLAEEGWSISGFGTVFDMSREGIVTTCMTEWYNERVEFKDKKRDAEKAADQANDPEHKERLLDEAAYYDMVQMVKKIFLNSTYGAYLNEFFRFYDPRLGSSVTLSSRLMTKHMIRQTSKNMTGNYDFDKRSIIYGDTDSVYASMKWYMEHHNEEQTVENAVKLADRFEKELNDSMPSFLAKAFMISEERGTICEAGREVVATRGLFKDKKKRYALHVVNNEHKSTDKLKIMGMETRRSDTPAFIQDFLEHVLEMVVKQDLGYDDVRSFVDDWRENTYHRMKPWERGSPGRVKKLAGHAKAMQSYRGALEKGYAGLKKPVIPIQVKAAMNTNALIDANNEHRWDYLRDGDKAAAFYLRPNEHGMDVVAIKVGETYVPEWFRELPFDNARMEEKLVDKKLFNVLGDIMGWEFYPPTNFADDVFEQDEDFYA